MKKKINIQRDLDSRKSIATYFPKEKKEEKIETNAESETIQESSIDESPEAEPKQKKGRRTAKGNA